MLCYCGKGGLTKKVNESDEEDQPTVPTAAEQINTIIQTETELQISPHNDHDEISNLTKSYMSIRYMMNEGKQLNRVQSGCFQHRCTTAGLATQHGPNWTTSFWKAATKQSPGPVLSAHTSTEVQKKFGSWNRTAKANRLWHTHSTGEVLGT